MKHVHVLAGGQAVVGMVEANRTKGAGATSTATTGTSARRPPDD